MPFNLIICLLLHAFMLQYSSTVYLQDSCLAWKRQSCTTMKLRTGIKKRSAMFYNRPFSHRVNGQKPVWYCSITRAWIWLVVERWDLYPTLFADIYFSSQFAKILPRGLDSDLRGTSLRLPLPNFSNHSASLPPLKTRFLAAGIYWVQ